MWSGLKTFIKAFGKYWQKFRGTTPYDLSLIIVSLIVGLLISNLLAGWIVGVQVAGTDPVQGPEIQPHVSKTDVSYENGMKIRGFEDLRWQHGYELYHVSVHNPGQKAVTNIQSTIDFPGCIVGYRKQQLADRVSLQTLEDAYIVQGNASMRVTHCDQELRISRLSPGDTATVAIVVKRFGTGFPNKTTDSIIYDQKVSHNATFSYNWWFKGHRAQKESTVRVKNANQSYVDTYLNFGLVAIENGEFKRGVAYHREAFEISPKNPEVLRKFGYAVIEYGYEQEDRGHILNGRDLINRGIELNSSNPWGWYYRAVAETYLAVTTNDTRETKIHYCLAKASVEQATRNGSVISPAEDLKNRLDEHNPGVECEVGT